MKTTITLVTLLVSVGCTRKNQSPTFLITIEKTPNKVLAVYAPEALLKKHGITAAQYRQALIVSMNAMSEAIAEAIDDWLADNFPSMMRHRRSRARPAGGFGDREAFTDGKTPRETPADPHPARTSPAGFREVLRKTRIEVWRMNPDGTHEVIEVISDRDDRS